MRRKTKWIALMMALCMAAPAGAMGLDVQIAQAAEETGIDLQYVTSEGLLKAGSVCVSADRMTEGQPFAAGTASSSKFRIPALITLDNGDLLAAADARWTGGADWGGLDTIASVSHDNGKTWYYSFPIFFPDSNQNYPGYKVATTAIDPVIVQGADGTIYCIADVNPSGITTGDIMPAKGTGFVEIDGKQRLVLTDQYTQPTSRDWTTYGDYKTYPYYVGDFDENGYAPVLKKEDNQPTKWGVDEWYNIYTINEETGAYEATLTQKMVNDDTEIQQNAFYKDSVLHVFNTGYLWMVTSTDGGLTWNDPRILNTEIKRDDDNEVALLASPGQGITTTDGDIVIPFYDHGDGQENASVIWSDDNGATWHRSNDVSGMWSSESEVVELNNGVLRMFFRNGNNKICYADITKVDGAWTMGEAQMTDIYAWSGCNVTAITHSKTIDGKKVVMVACPAGTSRADGKIFTFLVDEDNSMELYNSYEINEGFYAYSCMTEMDNGNIGLLWENEGTAIRFDEIELDYVLGYVKEITLDPGKVYEETLDADETIENTWATTEAVAKVTQETVVEQSKVQLHDHDSSSGFSTEAGSCSIEDAEFTFTGSDETWTIYNETKDTYLRSDMAGSYFGAEASMKVVKVQDGNDVQFRISKTDGTRYVMFYYAEQNFNSNDGEYKENYTAGCQEMVLLEKKEAVSENDLVPGYQRVSEITSGSKYLIAYVDADGNVMVLYPTNGKNAQTKLVGDTVDTVRNVLKITAAAPGKTTAVLNGKIYHITVNNPAESPAYAEDDYQTSMMTAIAGTQYNAAGAEDASVTEGPANRILDNNAESHWHSNYADVAEAKKLENRWVGVSFEEATEISGIRYLPRKTGTNGEIKEYQIQYSTTDDGEWIDIEGATGTWESGDKSWKRVTFDTVEAKRVRIVGVHTYGDQEDTHMSVAEFRVLKPSETSYEQTVSKVALTEALAKYSTLSKREYSSSTWAKVVAAVKTAESVDETASTQEEIDAAANQLIAAIVALEEKGEQDEEVIRLAGDGRLETSRKVATAFKEVLGKDKFDTIVVATSKEAYDALAGSYLAIAKDAPILLTNSKEEANADLLAYVKENAVAGAKIYILGGTSAVSADVKAMFVEEGYDVTQLEGQNRLETNKMILDAAGLGGQNELVVVTSKGYADSLSASATGRPILLVNPDKELNADQKAVLDHFKSGKVYIIGGESAVSEACKAALEEYLGSEITRVAGSGRYITTVEVAKTFFADADYAVVATGNDFPDGLCGGPLAAALNAPLLLTRDGNTKAADYAKEAGLTSGYVLGGDNALNNETVMNVFQLENVEDIK